MCEEEEEGGGGLGMWEERQKVKLKYFVAWSIFGGALSADVDCEITKNEKKKTPDAAANEQ